jgi:hypothetical protein
MAFRIRFGEGGGAGHAGLLHSFGSRVALWIPGVFGRQDSPYHFPGRIPSRRFRAADSKPTRPTRRYPAACSRPPRRRRRALSGANTPLLRNNYRIWRMSPVRPDRYVRNLFCTATERRPCDC